MTVIGRGLEVTAEELSVLVPGLSGDAVHALWLRSGGVPGVALEMAAELTDLPATTDAFVQVALATSSRAEFLQLDTGLIRLLEKAVTRPVAPALRARVLIRLARELLGDPTVSARRRALAGEAVALARADGDPQVIAEVLDGHLHALWDPADAAGRLVTAGEIVAYARTAGAGELERRGLFWQFVALAELGELDRAEIALTAYGRAAELAGDAEGAVVLLARQAMLATIRGRFDTASALTDQVAERGRQAGMADTDRLVAGLRGRITLLRAPTAGADELAAGVDELLGLARRLPGHFYEASAARALAELGRDAEALLEVERLMPAVLGGTGPRWLGAVADLAFVVSRSGDAATAQALFDVLRPYRKRFVVWGGANTIAGPVDDLLGRLAGRLGRRDEALSYFDDAIALEQRIGALPWLCGTLIARGRAGDLARARSIAERLGLRSRPGPGGGWGLRRDGDRWRLEAGDETALLPDIRGVGYLYALLRAPGQEIAALDLVAGGAGLRVTEAEPVLDEAARSAYRARLAELEEQLAAADRAGDPDRGAAAQSERNALVAELKRTAGLGARPRTVSDEAERARVNATRALRAVVERLRTPAPLVAAHLDAALHTGRMFRYQPEPGGPPRWHLG
ncbi:MAG: hypothetical protein ABW000_24490 [Actinoplanes sp.]